MFFKNASHETKFIQVIEGTENELPSKVIGFAYLITSLETINVDEVIDKIKQNELEELQNEEDEVSKIAFSLLGKETYNVGELVDLQGGTLKIVINAIKIAAGKMIVSVSGSEVNSYTSI